jgi:hypothetical protein
MYDLLLPKRSQGTEPCRCSNDDRLREVEDLLSDLLEDSKYFNEDLRFLRHSLVQLLPLNPEKM